MTALVDTRPLALDGGSRSLQDILNVETIVEQPTADIDIPINKGAGLQDPRAEDDHIACGILDIIGRYQVYDKAFELNLDSRYKNTFMPLLVRMIRLRSCIELVLPAFPFKSPNSQDKVLGTLPDKAEEVSLALLQGMCDAIKGMYEPGAQLTIVSDGIVYNDLLGVSDLDVWRYGEELRRMALDNDCHSIKFARISQASSLLDLPEELIAELDGENYQRSAPIVRLALERTFGDDDFDVSNYIKGDENVKATYRGYIKFLAADLAHQIYEGDEVATSSGASDSSGSTTSGSPSKSSLKRRAQKVAKQMIARGKYFAELISKAWPDAIRLSIHASNSSLKIPIGVLPNLRPGRVTTPWHCTVVCKLDGTFVPMKRTDLSSWSLPLEPVYSQGRLYCYRESSDLYNWGSINVTFEPLYPCGLCITALQQQTQYAWVPMQKLRKLVELSAPVILRNFEGASNEHLFVAKAREFGEVQTWNFGDLLKVRDGFGQQGGLNNVLSSEPMPFHYDGIFKMVDGKSAVPRFQCFTAATASPKGTGRTLFTPSRLVFQNLPHLYTLDYLRNLKWSVRTKGFGADHRLAGLPLIDEHPSTKLPIFRFHEHWPSSRTTFEESVVTIDDLSEEEGTRVRDALEQTMYDRRVCARVEWEKGDVLISDNIALLHTREAFNSNQGRELWRVHVD